MSKKRNVKIRPYCLDDAQPLVDAVHESIEMLSKYMFTCDKSYCVEDARGWIDTREQVWNDGLDYSCAIVDADTGEFLGGVGINHTDHEHRIANLGYWVKQSCHGQGIASVAAKLMAQFGFDELNFTRLDIISIKANAGSQRVAEKIGAVREAELRRRLYIGDICYDAVLYALFSPEILAADADDF